MPTRREIIQGGVLKALESAAFFAQLTETQVDDKGIALIQTGLNNPILAEIIWNALDRFLGSGEPVSALRSHTAYDREAAHLTTDQRDALKAAGWDVGQVLKIVELLYGVVDQIRRWWGGA